MILTRELLLALGVKPTAADRHLDALVPALLLHGVDTSLRIAHFLAQVVHESTRMARVEENLSYSAERLLVVFPRYFADLEEARAYAHQPERIGSRVYGGRMGNGNEASGDGYRFRGRGLIQLTGKCNYQAFSDWVGEDVVAKPDLVAGKYAAHSAVFFWSNCDLNPLADIDDLTAITKRINGGLNGFDDRFQLLERAKVWFQKDSVQPEGAASISPEVFSPGHRVCATALNLRSSPKVTPATWIATLAEGAAVQRLGEGGSPGWVQVRAMVGDALREGVVAERFLAPIESQPEPLIVTEALAPVPPGEESALAHPEVEPAHLRRDRADITRQRDGGWAFPLGESGRPARAVDATPADKAEALLTIVDWLDVSNPLHLRYRPRGNTTFCNIYAHDFCDLAGAYLPRVWWTDRALQRWQAGESPPVRYDDTVRELNANALHDWLADHGPGFGWHREIDLTTLQAAANSGEVCVIIAKRRDLNRSGHVSVVIPEHGEWLARRDRAGAVTRPVESQAGTRNHRVIVHADRPWWSNDRFSAHAFWRHR